jgi:hypothetical protein
MVIKFSSFLYALSFQINSEMEKFFCIHCTLTVSLFLQNIYEGYVSKDKNCVSFMLLGDFFEI